jgi:5-methyltetrahydrofolate--homocysteine methyltransferase
MADLSALTAAVEAGDQRTAVAVTQAAIDDGMAAQAILDAMSSAMEVIGGRFQRNEIYVPEMLISARAMKLATAVLEPHLVKAGVLPEHTAVIGTVAGDLHDIGKNLVGMMWKGATIAVVDLGTNVPADRFASAAVEHGASLVGISALLTTTMVGMREAVAAVRAAVPQAVVMVGGAPVTSEFAESIGADGYAADAAAAVDVARQLLASVPRRVAPGGPAIDQISDPRT